MTVTLICQLVILFFIFACIGWIIEVTLKFLQYHRFINRGFLIGPYCPIYGWGVVAITVVVGGLFARKGTIGEIFWTGYALCGVLEYFTSWYMEKRFHARWWDYSTKPMNLNGRIWVGNLILFGIGSVVIVCLVDPVFFRMAEKISPFWLHLTAAVIVVLFAADHIVTSILMDVVRKEIDAQEGDNTEEITARMHELLQDRSRLFRRIEQAYPDMRTQPHWLMLQMRQARKDYNAASRQVEELIREKRRRKEKTAADDAWKKKLDQALDTQNEAYQRVCELQSKLVSAPAEPRVFVK